MQGLALFLLLLRAIIQSNGEETALNYSKCELARESLERRLAVEMITAKQLGQQCREEKQQFDGLRENFTVLEQENFDCQQDKSQLEEENTKYIVSIREIGAEIHKCRLERETIQENEEFVEFGSGLGNCTEDIDLLKIELATVMREKIAVQEKLEKEIAIKAGLEEKINELNTMLQEEKECKDNFQKQLAEEKTENDELCKLLDTLKEEKLQLQKLSAEYYANYSETKLELIESRKYFSRLHAENKNLMNQTLYDELDSSKFDYYTEPFDNQKNVSDIFIGFNATQENTKHNATYANSEHKNELDIVSRNSTEKCGKIARSLDLTRTLTGIYYFSYYTALPWSKANDFCRSRGLDLATVESEDELFDIGRIRSLGHYVAFWTAASDRGHPPGQFHWPNGREVASSLWFPGQPDQAQSGTETCAYVFGSKLKDWPCTGSFYFACQVPRECV